MIVTVLNLLLLHSHFLFFEYVFPLVERKGKVGRNEPSVKNFVWGSQIHIKAAAGNNTSYITTNNTFVTTLSKQLCVKLYMCCCWWWRVLCFNSIYQVSVQLSSKFYSCCFHGLAQWDNNYLTKQKPPKPIKS